MEPILKWAGGKRNLLPILTNLIDASGFDSKKNRYYEPFIGGGALCFYKTFPRCTINDFNEELINVYRQIKEHPLELIELLKKHAALHSKSYYLSVRAMDRNSDYATLDGVVRAARIVYLNRTCYNGLYRVNKNGYFNVPMGKYKSPEIVMEDRILSLSEYFRKKEISILQGDFEKSVRYAKAGDLIYFDPPYDYDGVGFSTYTAKGFDRDDLNRLKRLSDRLVEKGCIVLISNNETNYVKELFDTPFYTTHRVQASRFISCDGKRRSKVDEVIIYGRKPVESSISASE